MAARSKPEASYASTRLTTQNYNGPSLLSQVGGKKIRAESKYGGADSQDEAAIELMKKKHPDPATDDEPLSSSDESTDSGLSGKSNKGESSAIKTKDDVNNGRSASEHQGGRKPARRNLPSQSSPKRTLSQMIDEGEDEYELFPSFMSSSQASKRRRNASYGGLKNIHSSSSFRVPNSSIENELSPPKSSQRFKDPRRIEDSPAKKTTDKKDDGFHMPIDIEFDFPMSKSRTRSKRSRGDQVMSRSSSGFHMPSGPNDHDVGVHSSQDTGFKEPPPLPSNTISTSSLTSKDALFGLDDDTSSSPLSSVDSDISFMISVDGRILLDETKPKTPAKSQSLCPMCKEPVDPELLNEFLSQSNQRMREQQRFCDRHQRDTAEKEWSRKGYPTIDWNTFDKRIRGHFASLDKILVPDCSSFYRNILDDAMKSGKAKNFRLTIFGDGLENLSCGYYGSKGASRMLHAVTTEFSRKLRRLAAIDNVVKTAGVAAYAQAVLVPELTVLLVKEDMDVSAENARQIVRESMEIGEKLNSAENDVIPTQDDVVTEV